MNKKAQITLFVIAGLVMIVLVGLLLMMRSISMKNLPPIDETTSVQTEFVPLKNYVETCISEIAKEGLKKIGFHGGYIAPENQGFYAIPGMPTSSSALEVFPGSGEYVPYWYHLKSSMSCTDCFFETNIPVLEGQISSSIESQLAIYLDENIDSCLNNFKPFNDLYSVEVLGDLESNIIFSETDVKISSTLPLRIISQGEVVDMNSFQTTLDVDFKRLYLIGMQILQQLELDNGSRTFEDFTTMIIDTNSMGDDSPLPPSTGFTVYEFAAPQIWIYSEVKDALQNLLAEYVPYNQILGSKEHMRYISDDEFSQSIFTQFGRSIYYDSDELSKVKINFQYLPWWPIYLDISPSNGGVIMPDSHFSTFIIPLALQTYDFTYDVSYPMLVTLEDKYAFGGKGFTLQFAFEVNIRNNAPITTDALNLSFELVEEDSLFGNPLHWTSGDITIKTIDKKSNLPLEHVLVSFDCVDESAFIGESKISDGEAKVVSKLPICMDGLVTGMKEDYFVTPELLTTSVGVSKEIQLSLEPVSELNMKIQKKELKKEPISMGEFEWVFRNQSMYLDDDESVIIIFTRQRTSISDDEFVSVYNVLGFNSDRVPVELVSGLYKIEAYSLLGVGDNYSRQEIVFPEKEMCYDAGLFAGQECQTIEEIVFNSTVFTGGILFDESTSGFVNISLENLESGVITLNLVVPDVDQWSDFKDLSTLTSYENYSVTHRSDLLPIFG
ncbi:MAG: hypothetical protein ABIC91_00810 [Nanoarchaeota archaeon]|nr:hypothetical protein [Nanoarchaeota archaeon]MBU1029912.1 hypothetical protein [Nanoarchaeota archaeon]MBU1850402.1 hypothetical protein [Nanoarchaeota archaeon]